MVLGKQWIKVEQCGTNLGIRIPQDIANLLDIKENTQVSIEVENGELKIKPKKDLSLDDLIGRITPDNRHGEISYGKAVGREYL